ncbi:VOC family protein [Nakamurella deserti]|uniref:VOC family protein n=1 Tax=Nakamurella deserti TaxID=2164074 RepID=UPI0014784C99|nr:VOC family protein [Nakamurella deserti]
MTDPVGSLKMVTLDSADASRDAAFWSAVLGWDITYDSPEAAMVSGPTSALGFGTTPGYEPPAWPNPHGSKQFHFDLAVEDLAAAERRCVELGAAVPDDQPGEGRWRVLLDPSGHPFCLTLAANWG